MIEFYVHQNKFAIPNAWEELTPGLFEGIMADMDLVTKGELSPAMLQVKHICHSPSILPCFDKSFIIETTCIKS